MEELYLPIPNKWVRRNCPFQYLRPKPTRKRYTILSKMQNSTLKYFKKKQSRNFKKNLIKTSRLRRFQHNALQVGHTTQLDRARPLATTQHLGHRIEGANLAAMTKKNEEKQRKTEEESHGSYQTSMYSDICYIGILELFSLRYIEIWPQMMCQESILKMWILDTSSVLISCWYISNHHFTVHRPLKSQECFPVSSTNWCLPYVRHIYPLQRLGPIKWRTLESRFRSKQRQQRSQHWLRWPLLFTRSFRLHDASE